MKSTCPRLTLAYWIANYIPSAHVGARFGYLMHCVGAAKLRVGSARLFGYQHVGIGKACIGSHTQQEPPMRTHLHSGGI